MNVLIKRKGCIIDFHQIERMLNTYSEVCAAAVGSCYLVVSFSNERLGLISTVLYSIIGGGGVDMKTIK